jgi:AraC family transcriptional regulator, transcriptional activator of pobA
MKNILEVTSFGQVQQLTGFASTHKKDFHIYRLGTVNKDKGIDTPLFRQHFFDITLFENTEFEYVYGSNTFKISNYTLHIVAPFQPIQLKVPQNVVEKTKGYVCYFSHDFLSVGVNKFNFFRDFPFFKLGSMNNVIPLTETQVDTLLPIFKKLQYENDNQHDTLKAKEIIQSYVWILMHECLRIYSQNEIQPNLKPTNYKSLQIADDFQEMVDANFQKLVAVEEYAKRLHISANHLTQTIKLSTGKSPKEFITERRIAEAKCLLRHTQMSIAQIAHNLNFSEPTYFTKFFKKDVGQTPLDFRLLLENI